MTKSREKLIGYAVVGGMAVVIIGGLYLLGVWVDGVW
jgi:hypothetical protein